VGRRAGLEGCRKFAPTGIRSPDRPTRSTLSYKVLLFLSDFSQTEFGDRFE